MFVSGSVVTQVRYAGYTLMGVLCTHQASTNTLFVECQAVMPAGLWSLCMQTLLNNQECDMVRGKVCIINQSYNQCLIFTWLNTTSLIVTTVLNYLVK